MTRPPEKVSSITSKPPQSNTVDSGLMTADCYQESLISVTVHSNKPLVNGSVRDPCFRRDDPSSGESFVNNQKTSPKEYVITEADEVSSCVAHIRNLLPRLPFTPPKRIVIPVLADERSQIPGSVIIESEKRKLSSQTPALLVPHNPG